MGLDLADTIQADNSMEKMLVHQMAAAHNSAMRMTALVNRRMESMANIIPDRLTMQNIERLNIETCRLAGTVTRMMNTFQQGMLTLQRVRTGGEQRVVVEQHQYVTRVEDGGQAVIGPKVRTRGGVRNGGGRELNGAMNLFFPHGNRVLQSPMQALAAEPSDAEAEERAGLRPWRMGAVGCMAAKAPGRARRKGSNGRDGLASCMGHYTAEAKAARAEARRTMRTLQLLLREARSE